MSVIKTLAAAAASGKKRKGRPPFGAVEVKTVESEEWMRLNTTSRHVYNILKTFYRGGGERFKAPFDGLKKRTGIRQSGTLHRAIQALEVAGWIEVTRYAKHGKSRGLRVKANEYRLTGKHDHLRH